MIKIFQIHFQNQMFIQFSLKTKSLEKNIFLLISAHQKQTNVNLIKTQNVIISEEISKHICIYIDNNNGNGQQ